ncbi:MAG: SRPBCC family protein [Bacteroidota bacterium]|nr:SRPBCC family protein [Bacteroidota bacterium]
MTDALNNIRTDRASRVIRASPETIYRAFLQPEAIASWRPPEGMKCQIFEFNPRMGGSFLMSFGYTDTRHAVRGKTSEHADVFKGRFLELTPNQRIVELIEFESDDPAFAGPMTIITNLVPVPGGTEVEFVAENVPAGIQPADHDKGMQSTLKNLAAFTE